MLSVTVLMPPVVGRGGCNGSGKGCHCGGQASTAALVNELIEAKQNNQVRKQMTGWQKAVDHNAFNFYALSLGTSRGFGLLNLKALTATKSSTLDFLIGIKRL